MKFFMRKTGLNKGILQLTFGVNMINTDVTVRLHSKWFCRGNYGRAKNHLKMTKIMRNLIFLGKETLSKCVVM